MIDKEKEVSTLHKNIVVVNQEDNNPLLSTADASSQNSFVQSSAIENKSSPTVGLGEKKFNQDLWESRVFGFNCIQYKIPIFLVPILFWRIKNFLGGDSN